MIHRFSRITTHPLYYAAVLGLNMGCALGSAWRGWWWSVAFFTALSLWIMTKWPTIWRRWRGRRR